MTVGSVVSSGVCLVNVRHGIGKGALEVTVDSLASQLCVVGTATKDFQLENHLIPACAHEVRFLIFI